VGGWLLAWPLLSTAGLFVLAACMAVTFEYDYWDCYVELGAVALCLYGQPWAALVGAVLWGLSRETVWLAVPLAALSGGFVCGLLACGGPAAWQAMKLYQGRVGHYYEDRWQGRRILMARIGAEPHPRGLRWARKLLALIIGPFNYNDARLAVKWLDLGLALSVAWMLAGLAVVLFVPLPSPFRATAWLMLAWPVAGILLARIRETRILLPMALWFAAVPHGL
jgi:hypothetical protein